MSSRELPPSQQKVRSKPGLSGRSTGAEGTGVVLPRRTSSPAALRVGTLSWAVGEPWDQSADELLASLRIALHAGVPCDLAVAAGLTVTDPPDAAEVLAVSDGTPVLFEARVAKRIRSWLLAHWRGGRPQTTTLRRRQLVNRFDDWNRFAKLAEALASGAGCVGFEDTDLQFVLFVCGENNLPRTDTGGSVLKAVPPKSRRRQALARVLGRPWVLLNPAHHPYYPHVRSTGFAKVGVVGSAGNQVGPTLRRLAELRYAFPDDTNSPAAVIHVNNFDARPGTAPYASVVFGDRPGRVRRLSPPRTDEVPTSQAGATRSCRHAVYEVEAESTPR
jgi:hypothetical protein